MTRKWRRREVFRGPVVFGYSGDSSSRDLNFYGATASAVMTIDTSADEVFLDGMDLWLKDDDQLEFGDVSDVIVDWDNANSQLLVAVVSTASSLALGTSTLHMDGDWNMGVLDIDLYGNASEVNINRNVASAISTGPVVSIKQDNTGDDQPALKIDQDATTVLALDANGWCDIGYSASHPSDSGVDIGAIRVLNAGSKWWIAVSTDGSGTFLYSELSSTSTA